MMKHGFIAPTCNLEKVDPACAGIRHVLELQTQHLRRVLSNNFAFGGINASLLLGEPT
jgi:3-oxoacyl-[acyl-carrier-protein] synthase II